MKKAELVLRQEDFPDLSTGERTERLLRVLNRFGTEVSAILSNGITFAENVKSSVKVISFTAPLTTQKFKNPLASKPAMILLGDCRNITAGGDTPTSAANPAWEVSGDQIVISSITGLTSGQKYKVTLLLLGG